MSEERATYMSETPEDHTYQIRDEAPHDFYSQIPNLVDELNLTPYAYRLYGHLRRVAGESGKCWQSTKTLSEKCRMSMGSVSIAKEELENTYPPLIRVSSKKKENGIYHEITITDIWSVNHAFFTGEVVHLVKTPPKRSPSENPPSPSETKKNPLEEEPKNGVPPTYPVEWQIAGENQTVTMQDDFDAKAIDTANLIATGLGVLSIPAYNLSYAFMSTRHILIPEGDIKGNRKAVKEMLKMNVAPVHVVQATQKLIESGMTITDLFSVKKTAIDLANPTPETIGYNPQELSIT